jgi:hypothetical protein
MVKMVITEFKTVSEMESATLPRSIKVTKLEVTPPGQNEITRKPTFKIGSKLKYPIIYQAKTGSRMICESKPMVKDPGFTSRFLKSFLVKVRPKLKVIKAKTRFTRISICWGENISVVGVERLFKEAI